MTAMRMSEYDFEEILRFKQYLLDKATMEPVAFFRKYQAYLGMSEVDIQAIINAPQLWSVILGRDVKPN